MASHFSHNLGNIRKNWALLTLYQRFEAAVAWFLTLLIAVVVLVALYRLTIGVLDTLVLRSLNPLEHEVFRAVFGQIMTVLIALEFNHTLWQVITGERGIIQAKIVILIAVFAVVRRIIVVEVSDASPAAVGALALLVLALGATYWLMRERDDQTLNIRHPNDPTRPASGAT